MFAYYLVYYLSLIYSSLMASTGLMLMARHAGASPASPPSRHTTRAESMAVQKFT